MSEMKKETDYNFKREFISYHLDPWRTTTSSLISCRDIGLSLYADELKWYEILQ